jgi:hypothetical protein
MIFLYNTFKMNVNKNYMMKKRNLISFCKKNKMNIRDKINCYNNKIQKKLKLIKNKYKS